MKTPSTSCGTRKSSSIALLASFALCSACSGGSQGSPSPFAISSSAPSQSASKDKVTFRIDTTNAATASNRTKKPQYISPATTEMLVNIEQNGTSISGYPTTVPLTPTADGCTSSLATTYCAFTVALAPGNYSATLTAEDANKQALSTAQNVAFTVSSGTANVVNLTLSGIPAEVDVTPGSRAVHGTQNGGLILYGVTAQPIIVNAKDIDGNIIVGPGSPTYTITLESGNGWTAGSTSTTTPNTFMLTPPQSNGSGAVLRVTANYPDSTCSIAGAVCTNTFSVKNDIQTLFIPNYFAGVTVYGPPYTGTPTTISNSVSSPIQVALDAAGDLFVSSFGNSGTPNGLVSEYKQPYTNAPIATITNGIDGAASIALDAAGNLFVANYSGNSVTIYAPPYTASPTTISNGVDGPVYLALDRLGNLFVANYSGNDVTVYAPPYTGAPKIINNGVGGPQAMALDDAGNLFVAQYNAPEDTVVEYAPPYTGAPTTISNGVDNPYALTLDSLGNLFVANYSGNTVTVYAPPYTGVPTTISTGVSTPDGLAVDGAGDLFIANYLASTVTEYVPPYTGAPVTISNGVDRPAIPYLSP